jgi:ATP-dependent Clp protease ATP-binding subunit ClpX
MGPTGCGKTYLVELLFSRILGLPTIIADMTSFTETGYIGDSVSNLFTRLVQAAGGDQLKAAVGVICLDEFDKLAACGSRARFGGQGTTKDVSGYGVQRELLKLLETTNVHAGEGQESEKTQVRTADIPFIACGAFSGFKAVIKSMQYEPCIGFGVKVKRQKSRKVITERVAAEEVAPVANFAEYGMLPELMGRFSRIVPLQPMGVDELMKILTNQVIVRYQKELASEGVRLEIEPPILERIARECLKMETGARGIVASLAAHLENACFDVYSLQDPSGSVIRVREESGRITTELTAGTGDGEIGAVTLQALCA